MDQSDDRDHVYDPGVGHVVWDGGERIDVFVPNRQSGIPAPDVPDGTSTWYATYSFDPERQTLFLDRPTTFEPPDPPVADPPDDDAQLATLSIDRWGSAPLKKPLVWSGPVRGFVKIRFMNETRLSGPIGTVNGP